MKRKIVHIDEDKCNGCGLCIDACHERALQMVDGKARLITDEYCDGLGDCLPECPTGAISIVEREAKPFDEELVEQRIAQSAGCDSSPGGAELPGCPAARASQRPEATASELRQWPVQLRLVSPKAGFFEEADLLIAADCTAFAYGSLHSDYMAGKTTLILCPKLDDSRQYQSRLRDIVRLNRINSLTVVRMEVPCCGVLSRVVRRIISELNEDIPFREVVLGCDGSVISD